MNVYAESYKFSICMGALGLDMRVCRSVCM